MNIASLWRDQPGEFFCVSTKSRTGRWRDNFFERKKLCDVRQFIRDNHDKDIYFCPHGFSEARRGKDCSVAPRMLYADLDEADPRDMDPKPTIAIESSPGRYVGLWLVEKEADEHVNRRLTYKIGADHGGWDRTQVLRIPGTNNYKYPSAPRVRLLWDDGPTYELRDVLRGLPDENKIERASHDFKSIWKQYERKLPAWVRREIVNGRPTAGKRSEMLWKLEHALLDAGLSLDEALECLWVSAWNKFKDRRDGREQIRRELEKIIAERGAGVTEHAINGYKFGARSLADVEEEEIDWIWYPYLARGEITLLEGDPGTGKSWVAQMVGKAICDGEKLPVVRHGSPSVRGKVFYCDTENDPARVTAKRMRWNGLRTPDNFVQEVAAFSVDDEEKMAGVYECIERIRPTLVVFDTINLYIGRIDVNRSNEVTQALQPFVDIARRFKCAVVVIRHLTKGSGVGIKAMYRGQGNIAFSAVARIQLTIGTDPEDADTNVLGMTKNNLAAFAQALTFTKIGAPTLKDPERCLFEWGDFVDNMSSEDILGPSKKSTAADDAIEFLKDILANGEIEVSRIETMASKRAFSWRTVQRAAKGAGVKITRQGFGKTSRTVWELA